MNNLILNILHKQKLERDAILKDSTVQREAGPALQASLSRKLIKAVIGPRRSGKSSLIHQILTKSKTNYAYLNFEDEQLPIDLEFEEFSTALKKVYPDSDIYFFDEIQIFPRWEQLLNRLERNGKRIIISGSNSKLLGSELASSLTGRHELFEILPFSYVEYCRARPEISENVSTFMHYLRSGGFPDVVMNRVLPQNYLRELWDSILLKDIVQRYKIRSVTELKALLNIVRDSVSRPLNHRSLERALLGRLSTATIGKFLSYSQGAYLSFLLQNFSFKSRTRVSAEKKVYLIDNGFYTSMRVGGQEDNGQLLENFVFITLLRRGLSANLDFFFYKTRSGREVDFLILEGGKPRSLIQVCWTIANEPTLEREMLALSEAREEIGVKELIIVTAQERASQNSKGLKVQVLPIRDFK